MHMSVYNLLKNFAVITNFVQTKVCGDVSVWTLHLFVAHKLLFPITIFLIPCFLFHCQQLLHNLKKYRCAKQVHKRKHNCPVKPRIHGLSRNKKLNELMKAKNIGFQICVRIKQIGILNLCFAYKVSNYGYEQCNIKYRKFMQICKRLKDI